MIGGTLHTVGDACRQKCLVFCGFIFPHHSLWPARGGAGMGMGGGNQDMRIRDSDGIVDPDLRGINHFARDSQ